MFSWFSPGRAGRRPPPRHLVQGKQRCEPHWAEIMGFEPGSPRTLHHVEARFRRLALAAHPDRGGSTAQMQRLIRARAAARRDLS